jgi:hypothetical protein
MLSLIRKAAPIFLIVFIIYVLCYAAGYVAGKHGWADYKTLQNSSVFKLSRNLEYRVPGYSFLLKQYKTWHDNCRTAYLFQKNVWGMGTLIFINNFFVANLTMIIRALFVLPIMLTVFGKFFQGVLFAQTPVAGRLLSVFIMEFGGYFLTVCGTLTAVLWTAFPRLFNFPRRREAFRGGLKIFGLAVLLSALGMLIGSILETRLILSFY